MTSPGHELTWLLNLAEAAVRTGGEIARTHTDRTVTDKGDRDLVSNADLASEAAIREILGQKTPDIPILGEEGGGPDPTDGPVWVVDPIDGTINHLHGLPTYATAISLLNDGEAVLAATYQPEGKAMYTAIRGKGAHRNGRPIRTSGVSDLRQAVVAMDQFTFTATDPVAANAARLEVLRALVPVVGRIRIHGCSTVDLAWVADGRLDASIILANYPWDTSGGVLIAREAGGIASDAAGTTHRTSSATTVVASSPALATAILGAIASCSPS